MKKPLRSKSERPLIVFAVLIFLSVAAGITDFICYYFYLRDLGLGWLDTPSWGQRMEYLKSPIGGTLTLLGLAPYPAILLWVWIQKPKN